MAHLLGGEHLHVEFPAKVVLDDVTVGVADGDRIGIVGRNGDGKSTLMKVLTGRFEPDAGRVTRRGGLRVGMLSQDDDLPGSGSIRDAVVGDRPEHEWLGDARVRDVLDGLLGDLDITAPVAGLSGGQRRRVSLARLLVGDWDVLALDESSPRFGGSSMFSSTLPTNAATGNAGRSYPAARRAHPACRWGRATSTEPRAHGARPAAPRCPQRRRVAGATPTIRATGLL